MLIATIIDRTIRAFAALAAIAVVPVVFVVGIMANDAGRPAGVIASLIILGVGGSLVWWILLCSFRPPFFASPLLYLLLVQLPTYVAGAGGVLGCLHYLHNYYHDKSAAQFLTGLRSTDANYPKVNPNPTHRLELTGTLPRTIPISDFEATYATDKSTTALVTTPCQRLIDDGPQEMWYTLPLRVKEPVPLIRDDEQNYRATLMADRFLPGNCNWHLQEIHFRSKAPGYVGRALRFTGGDGQVQVRDKPDLAGDLATGKSIYHGRMDLWCFRAPESFGPELCGDWSVFDAYVPLNQQSAIPKEWMNFNPVVYVTSESQTIQFNFHDVEEFAEWLRKRPPLH